MPVEGVLFEVGPGGRAVHGEGRTATRTTDGGRRRRRRSSETVQPGGRRQSARLLRARRPRSAGRLLPVRRQLRQRSSSRPRVRSGRRVVEDRARRGRQPDRSTPRQHHSHLQPAPRTRHRPGSPRAPAILFAQLSSHPVDRLITLM